VGIADTISKAEIIAEKEVSSISGPLFHRNDIGTDKLIQKRINHMKEIKCESI
jgi:phosphoribosylamine--glycine ligase